MSKSNATENWGGKRARAGRPAKHRKQVQLMLPPETDEALEKVARALGKTKSDFVDDAIQKQLPKPMRRPLLKASAAAAIYELICCSLDAETFAQLKTLAAKQGVSVDQIAQWSVAKFIEEGRE
jgi:hypothetical protein